MFDNNRETVNNNIKSLSKWQYTNTEFGIVCSKVYKPYNTDQ